MKHKAQSRHDLCRDVFSAPRRYSGCKEVNILLYYEIVSFLEENYGQRKAEAANRQ